MYTIHTIVHAFHAIIIRHIVQKSPKNTPNFLHIAQQTSVHPIVYIVQWYGISHFCVQLPLKTLKTGLFLLKIVRKISSPTNFTE